MRHNALLAIAAFAAAVPAQAEARGSDFNIPAGRLDQAIMRFGEQSGLTVGIIDPGLAGLRTSGLKGRYSAREGLRRLLRGTGATFQFVNARTVRIVAAKPVKRERAPLPPAPLPPAPPPEPPPIEIVVTASKQNTLLASYAGSVDVVKLDPAHNARHAARGTAAIIARLPLLASTGLGPGRDKLFIRGVADSSFAGPTQATVGQYLGDVRLTYNAPDPDLHLYDLDSAEVLAGPQGTLYGTGALGGIIRLVPNQPDASAVAGSASVGITATRKGAAGNDAAAMVNLPLARDRLALRAVGYRVVDGGYIDDTVRDLANVNRTRTYGARVTLRFQPGDDWTLDAGGVMQNIGSRDGQYTLRGAPDLTRGTALAQPFDNDYRLAHLRVAKSWRGLDLVSSTSLVRHDVDTTFDATQAGSPLRRYEEAIEISLLSHETRLSGRRGGDTWVAGIGFVRDVERRRRTLGDPGNPAPITGVRSEVVEAALFGQYALALTPRLTGTVGGRLTHTRTAGQSLDAPLRDEFEPRRSHLHRSPSVSLSWRPAARTLVFVRFQEGARAGGLTIGPGDGPETVKRFERDTLEMIEAGFRFGTPGRDPLTASATLSYSLWSDIQADLVDGAGLPFTVNIGDGRILGLDTHLTWKPVDPLQLELSAFFNRTRLTDPAPAFVDADERDLPNVAENGGRAALSYQADLKGQAALSLDASVRFVGKSRLGIGAPLDVTQGGYFETALGGRLTLGAFGLSLDVSNLGDVRGNRFAFGNPFGLAARNQITPLRPRSIRVGLDARF